MKERIGPPKRSERVGLVRSVSTTYFVRLLILSLVHAFSPAGVPVALFAQPRTDGIGPDERYYPVHNFRDDFLVYDDAAKAYIPYIVEQHGQMTALSAYVDLESNRRYSLLVSTEQDGYLFINAALKGKLPAGRWRVLSIDSLYRAYRQPEIFLTLYGAPGLADKRLYIGYPKSSTQQAIVLRNDNLSVRPRPASAYTNFIGLGLLFLLATHAFLFTFYRRAFLRFFNVRDLLSLRATDDSFLINRPLSSTNLLFIINLSFVLAYLILFVQSRQITVFTSRFLQTNEQTLRSLLGQFFLLSFVWFVALLGKYAALQVLGGLYKLEEMINVHFFKVLQSSLLFFTGLVLLTAVVAYNTTALVWPQSAVLLPLVGFYTARLLLLYAVIRSLEPVKNLYLFSYLCIVELIPLIVGLRFAL